MGPRREWTGGQEVREEAGRRTQEEHRLEPKPGPRVQRGRDRAGAGRRTRAWGPMGFERATVLRGLA